jgi:ribonuclease HI
MYTDGSSLGKPRKGGIGVRYVVLDDEEQEVIRDEAFFGFQGASNNQMELLACVEGLKKSGEIDFGIEYDAIEIRSDSRCVTQNISNAKYIWPKQGWLGYSGQPILNVEIWLKLLKQIRAIKKRIDFVWIKGHATDHHNKEVDRSAKTSARSALNPPLSVVTVRRKLTKEKTKVGSVVNSGQTISIRIVSSEWLKMQSIARYRYEVVSPDSEFYQKIDFACSYEIMRDGHSYEVVLNDEPGNPRILGVVREIEKNPKGEDEVI